MADLLPGRRPGASPIVIGVVADTHVPDRVREIHPGLAAALCAAGVQHILHAGDICTRAVLEQLGQVAPVTAARGNRDLLIGGSLRMIEQLEFGGVPVALMHGHGSTARYLWDKAQYILFGYRLKRYVRLLVRAGGPARVVVFGHTHRAENVWRKGKLLFNPGSASFGVLPGDPPTYGLLRIFPGGQVSADIYPLRGYTIRAGHWVKEA